ncbi:MAG: hypothetical protein F4Z55_19055 [Boseongicola sp. SB0667_bin_21]|nr:hypothetical protein [Boseongicola sp. SB0667_bin_21]
MADIEKLIEARDRAREEFRTIGDMRPGSLQENLTRCGKPNCRCAEDDAARHPGTILTRSIVGKVASTRLRRDEVEETRPLLDEYQRFRGVVSAFVAASESLAEARRKERRASGPGKGGASRRRSGRRSRPTSTG